MNTKITGSHKVKWVLRKLFDMNFPSLLSFSKLDNEINIGEELGSCHPPSGQNLGYLRNGSEPLDNVREKRKFKRT